MDKDIFVQNVKRICAQRGIKPTVACKESGAGKDLINQIETRGSIPSVEKVQLLASYLGVTVSELLGEAPPGGGAASKADMQAAFWGGDRDLSQEEMDAMWDDVERFAQFLAEKKRQERMNGD